MRDSILYSAIRALFVSFCVIIGLTLAFVFMAMVLGLLGGTEAETQLTTVTTEEILPNAKGERKALGYDVPVILQVNIDNVIGTEILNTSTVTQQLVESREGVYKKDRVKAILLYINSPGGTVMDADGIFNALLTYKKKYNVPIYAFVDGLCASGGLYISLAADKIFSRNVSLIGSVGVIVPSFVNVSKLLEKYDIETLTLSAGKDKDAMNPLRPWKAGESENYKQLIDYFYNHFVDLVTQYRPKVNKELLINDYGAKIFTSKEALERGFIDVNDASLSDALSHLLEKVNITDDNYQVIKLESRKWWKSLFSSDSSLFTGKVKHQISLSPEIDLMCHNKFLYLYYPQ
jgi:protease-4